MSLIDVDANGERNRILYVLKSRGMDHSKQFREYRLLLGQPALCRVGDRQPVARLLQGEIGATHPRSWSGLINQESMTSRLATVKNIVTSADMLKKYPAIGEYWRAFVSQAGTMTQAQLLKAFLDKEARIAGYLVFLAKHSPDPLASMFFRAPKADLAHLLTLADPLLSFGHNNYRAILSPIGIVHLYREYFFEFDSFLGPPVGHVWLSPGGTVELIEISTRRKLVEQSLEQSLETTQHSEQNTTSQDDVADAVKEDNRNDVKFGFTNTAHYSSPVFQDTANPSFSLDSAKTSSRETTHKSMRQQSEKLSSDIKRNFKTTFKTSTETTDATSKRYLLQNTSCKLVHYELRRKMRKVGVQVQDIGVQLCWQTFVDSPGQELGLGQMVHLADPPQLADLVQPDQPEVPPVKSVDVYINIPFVGIDTDDADNAYTNGTETEVGVGNGTEHILADFAQEVTFPTPHFTLSGVTVASQGANAKVSVHGLASTDGSSKGTFVVHLNYVNWNGQSNLTVKATLTWSAADTLRDQIQVEYDKRMAAYTAEKARRFKEAFFAAARERIKLASRIQAHPSEDLREEERTVVYRRLLSQLLTVGTSESKHVTSELIRSIFDVDKMLYFVAPEWWLPRLHSSAQQLGGTGKTVIPAENIVKWSDAQSSMRDNYYITDESAPAKLGSSLGWLLQLDGDNLRNAVLNSPWVKAVIPIRLGKEQAAINWLAQAHVEGSDGLDAAYAAVADAPPELHATPGHPVTVKTALNFLIDKIHEFDAETRKPIAPNPPDPESPSNHFAGSLPTEAVFEHGFYPLQGGVKFDGAGTEQAIFSQWMEILSADQVVALQVEYDPKTLQIKEPADPAP